MEEVRIDAGLQRFEVRGQCGDKTGTKRGHYQYVKKIYSFTYIRPFFSPAFALCLRWFCLARLNRWRWCPVLVFCSSEERPAHGFDVFGRCWRCGCPRVCTVPPLLCCLPWCGIRCPANGRERTAPEMAAKSAPFAPLSAALLTLWVWFACLWGVCGAWWPAPAAGCWVLCATRPDRCHLCGPACPCPVPCRCWPCPCPVPCRCWPCPCGVWWPSPAAEC